MKIIDLTHTIENNMTIFPGGLKPDNKVISTVSDMLDVILGLV